MSKVSYFVALFICFLFDAEAAAQPSIEVYGQLPLVRSIAISPNGEYVAGLTRSGDRELAVIFSISPLKVLDAIDVSAVKARSLSFASERFVILRASKTIVGMYISKFEYSSAFSWDMSSGTVVQLLGEEDMLNRYQSGLGRIVGKLEGSDHVFMPAFIKGAGNSPMHLLKVDLRTGRAEIHARGTIRTTDWLVGSDGAVIAREDFNDSTNEYSIWDYRSASPREILSVKTEVPHLSFVGVTPDRQDIIMSIRRAGRDHNSLVRLSSAGSLSRPIFERDDANVERILSNVNRVVYGVMYSGLRPSYQLLDGRDPIATAYTKFRGAAVSIEDWTDGFQKIVLHVAGGDEAPKFHIFDKATGSATPFVHEYQGIPDHYVGRVLVVEYEARDGTKIPGLLTMPPMAAKPGPHPTIVMPHGGPESYDAIGFDWMAQYFASRGFVVLQPNFRGSDGFGAAFRKAGHGEWGRGIMQHDITDSLTALIAEGIADPDKVCIVGSSYGGYAALAGGAFTPDLYRCVAAIAPISDLPKMIADERTQSGRQSWVVSYWTNLMGDIRKERRKLESISPVNYAELFKAPVLLIHGYDDTVVPYDQSKRMKAALEKAKKDVELVGIKGGDHWLSTSITRLETLQTLDAFVIKHLGRPEAADPGDSDGRTAKVAAE